MNRSLLSQIACRTAAAQNTGQSVSLLFEKELITASMSVPCAQPFVMYITSVGQNPDIFFPSSFMLFIPVIRKQMLHLQAGL